MRNKFIRHMLTVVILIPTISILTQYVFGITNPYASFLLVFMAYMFATWRDAKDDWEEFGNTLWTSIHQNPKTWARTVALLVAIALTGSYQRAQDPDVLAIQHWVEIFGSLLILTHTFYFTLTKGFNGLLSRALGGLAAYTIILWLIGVTGDDIKELLIEDPKGGVLFLVAIMLLQPIYKVMAQARDYPENSPVSARAGVMHDTPRTPRDLQYAAAHEIGHLLPFAALSILPDNLEVRIDAPGGPIGYVVSPKHPHRLMEKTYAEWFTLMLLGGRVGELFLYGEHTLGSIDDNNRWIRTAHQLLSNQNSILYYPSPETRLEQESNDRALEQLRTQQWKLLDELFNMNETLYRELVERLTNNKTLKQDEIQYYLQSVKLPDGFPTPNLDETKLSVLAPSSSTS